MLGQGQLQIVLTHHNRLLTCLFPSDSVCASRHIPRATLPHLCCRLKNNLLRLDPTQKFLYLGALFCLQVHKLMMLMMVMICTCFGGA